MTEFLLFITGLLIGGIIAAIYATKITKKDYQSNIYNLEKKLSIETNKRITAESQLAAANESQQKSDERLKVNFDALISKAIVQNNEQFLKLAGQTIEKYVNKSDTDISKRSEELKQLIKPLNENFEKQENLLKQFELSSSKTFGNLRAHIEALTHSQKNLEKETGALVTALKAPKIRGRWGEIGLKRIVEFSGMNEYCDYSEQTQTDNSRLRPDLIVKLPENKSIVVDSKVPLNAYLEAMETDDELLKKEMLQKHSKAVTTHVKNLSSKSYWTQFDNAIDFVVLYIEVEPAFGAALIENKNLIEEALKNRIIFATPTTLITLLQTIAFSWKQHKATENALELWKLNKEFYERLSKFSEHFQKVGYFINSLTKTYNQAVGSWENRVMPGIRKIESHGISSPDKSPDTPKSVEVQAKEMK